MEKKTKTSQCNHAQEADFANIADLEQIFSNPEQLT